MVLPSAIGAAGPSCNRPLACWHTNCRLSLPGWPLQLRKERAEFKPDDRFLHVVNMIRTGQFGWADCEWAGACCVHNVHKVVSCGVSPCQTHLLQAAACLGPPWRVHARLLNHALGWLRCFLF